jgi:hypothetical protein
MTILFDMDIENSKHGFPRFQRLTEPRIQLVAYGLRLTAHGFPL